MKIPFHSNLSTSLLLVCALATGNGLPARQENPAPPPPAGQDAAAKPAAPEAQPEAAQDEAKESAGENQPAPAPVPEKKAGQHAKHSRHHSGDDRVGFWRNSTLPADESADSVVSIFGSSSSAGEVGDAVVSVFGSSNVTGGSVGDAVVSVLGGSHVENASVGDAVVSVLGDTFVDGHVHGEVVSVLGSVELGPNAVVDGEIVCVGGEVKRNPAAVVHGSIQNVAIAGHVLGFTWLQTWMEKCLFYLRPLAFGAHLAWAWAVALAFLGFYVLVALAAPGGVNRCVQTFEQRPGSSIVCALLAMLLTPVVFLLLAFTLALGIGFVLVPLFAAGLFFAALFGRVVLLTLIGQQVVKLFSGKRPAQPVMAVLAGGAVVLVLYTVPVLGFILYKLMGVLGLGVVVYTLIGAAKRNRPAAGVVSVAAAGPAASPTGAVAPEATSIPAAVPAAPGMAELAPPPILSAVTLPRAGFWIRIAASFLDMVLIVITSVFLHIGPGFMLLYAAYCALMWATKGTTIGGIICGLKVVRLDGRPLDWSIAIVRVLGGFLSLAIAGLGFIWVAFDDERQSWHDKIAGTTIVQVPKGTPLL